MPKNFAVSTVKFKRQKFNRRLLRIDENGKIEQLKGWLNRAVASGINEMASFVKGIKQDLAAVEAAIETKWINGQVEGQVNCLKTIWRTMYGRAKFDLLRAKVLYAN